MELEFWAINEWKEGDEFYVSLNDQIVYKREFVQNMYIGSSLCESDSHEHAETIINFNALA